MWIRLPGYRRIRIGRSTPPRRRSCWSPRCSILLVVAAIATAAAATSAQEVASDAIEARVEEIRTAGTVTVSGSTLRWSSTLTEFYRERAYRPLWTDPRFVRELVAAVEDARRDGLDSDHYHAPVLPGVGPAAAAAAVDLEILRTDALLRLAHDLRFGRANPDRPWDASGAANEAAML